MLFVVGLVNVCLFSQEKKDRIANDTISNTSLDEVVVTATRSPRQLSSVPMPVTLISKKQLQQAGSVRLRDILLEQAGIVMVKDNGNSEGVQIQGIAADYILILIDGVPIVGRTAGNIDLNRLTVNNIKQIEIVKGPSSSLYGSEAMGGVINIITERPSSDRLKSSYSILTRGGAMNELDINANTMAKLDRLSFVAGINLNSSGGFDLTPETPGNKTMYPYQNYTGNLRLGYTFSEHLKAFVSGRLYHQEQNTPFSDNIETDWNWNTMFTHTISDIWSLDYTFYATRNKTESVFNGETALYNRSLFRPEIKTTVSVSDGATLIAGLGANYDALARTSFESEKNYEAYYVFGQYDFNPLEKLNIVVGARFDSHNAYESAFSPKLSARYEITDWLSTRGSVGYGFKAPDFRQLYFNFRNTSSGYVVFGTETIYDLYAGNESLEYLQKQLQPESSIGYNFGFQIQPLKNLSLNLNVFRNDIQNLIDTYEVNAFLKDANVLELDPEEIGLGRGTRIFSYRNINKVYTQGLEVELNYRINDNLRVLGGYQYLDTGDKEEEKLIESGTVFVETDVSDVRLTLSDYFGLRNRSKHTGNLKLFYDNYEHKFSANVRALYRSKYAITDTNKSRGIIDIYDAFVSGNLQINAAIEKELFSLFRLQFGVDNIGNETGSSNADVDAFLVGGVVNDAVLLLGRTFYGRVTFNF